MKAEPFRSEFRAENRFAHLAIALGLLIPALSVSTPAWAQGAPNIIWSQPGFSPVSFSPTGTLLASAGANATVKLWQAANGALVRTLRPHYAGGGVNVIAFSPDGSLLAVGMGGFNQNLNIWRVADGALLFGRITAHANGTQGAAYSPDGRLLATGGRDRTTKTRLAANMTLQKTLTDGSRVFSLAYSPDGAVVVSGCQGIIHIWRVADGALLHTINAITSYVFAVAISPEWHPRCRHFRQWH